MRNTFLHELISGFVLLSVPYRTVTTKQGTGTAVRGNKRDLDQLIEFRPATLFGYVPA